MNARKLIALALAVACSTATAQTTTVRPTDSSLSGVSLLQLVNEAKAAVATNADLAALFADIGDVTKLSETELQKLVKSIVAVTGTKWSSGSGSLDVGAGSKSASKSITTAPAPVKTTAAPVTAPTGAASSLALAPAAALALAASVLYTLL